MADCPAPSHHQAQPARRMALRFVAASGGLVGLFMAGLITLSLVSRFGA